MYIDEYKAKAVESGAIEVVLNAMKFNMSSAEMCKFGFITLRVIVIGNGKKKKDGDTFFTVIVFLKSKPIAKGKRETQVQLT